MEHLPPDVARRIMKRCEQIVNGNLVLRVRKGRPTRVFGEKEHLSLREHAGRVRPWTRRGKGGGAFPDPLGAADGRVLGSLRREEIYD